MNAPELRAALERIVAAGPAAMVLSDPHAPDAPLVAVNDAFCAMTGYAEAEVLGRNCRFLQGPDTDPATPARIRACLAAGQGCVEWIVNHRKDGTPFYNLLFVVPVRDDTGAVVLHFGNQMDVTLGFPLEIGDVSFGSAVLPDALDREFHDRLAGLADLAPVLDAARRLAALSTRMVPGGL